MGKYSQDELDNHSDQLNPNNDAYWQSRGFSERPDDWDNDSSADLIDLDDCNYDACCSDDFD